MSIETLLEAAKFLELQAQQQQKTREENELKERLRQEQEAEQRKRTEAAAQAARVNSNHHHHHNNHHITWVEEPSGPERRLAPLPPQPPPPSLPIAVIPIPVVSSAPAPQSALSPAPSVARSPPNVHQQQHHHQHHHQQGSPRKDTRSPPNGQHPHPQHVLISPQPKPEPGEPTSLAQSPASVPGKHQQPHLLQSYPGTIMAASQHASPPQLASPHAQANAAARASPPDDGRHGDGKKRPGGAGTREVHNKLEKNRRAHLKECFETLKKNIPNVDEKKASNLSVLRSALRYIQTLKRKEKEFEHEMERLAREKIATQQRLAELKNELSQWMDVLEIDRILRQTVQPEDDQASTSTASEGEDNIEDDIEEQSPPASSPKVPQAPQPESRKTPPVPTKVTLLNNHHHHHHHHPMTATTLQHKLSPQLALSTTAQTVPAKAQIPVPGPAMAPTTIPSPVAALSPVTSSPLQPQTLMAPQALLTAHAHIVAAPGTSNGIGTVNNAITSMVQPTVIAHAAPATHASVIQATVNHIIQPAGKQTQQVQTVQALPQQPGQLAHPTTLAHLAPPAAAPQPIGHITVHPVAHLSQHHLPAIYPQPVAVTQPAMVSHIAHTFTHAQINGASPGQMGKPAAAATAMGAQVVAHHPQLVGQTVLNPVTMVTMPSFPVSTLKLA